MRLGLTLPLLPLETLPSFVSHIAQKNGSRHMQDFVHDMDLSWRGILQLDPATVQEMADLAGADAEALSAGSFSSISRGRLCLRGHELPRTFLDRSGQKYCPVCVEKDHDIHGRTWGRALWQIDSIHVCADHGVALRRLGKADYPRSQHDFAGRMADHQQLVGGHAPAEARRSARNFARYLSNRLLKNDSSKSSPWLDDLPVDVASRLCENIGALITNGAETRPHDLAHKDLIAAGAAGFEVCKKGPDAMWEVYDDIRRRSPNTKGGFSVDFGFHIRWLQRRSDPERYLPIVDHFRMFVIQNYPIRPGQKILGQVVTERHWYRWSELRHKHGLSPARIKRYRRAMGVGEDDLRRVAPDRHDAELSLLSTGLDRKQVSRQLNVHSSAIDRLHQDGLLQHAIALPNMDRLFDLDDVESFLRNIFAHTALVDVVPDGAWPLRTIACKAKLKNADLFRALMAGRLKKAWRLLGVEGLPALHLDLAEVLDCFEAPPLTSLSRDDVRKRLHICASTVRLLLSNGMIASSKGHHPRSRRQLSLIEPKELDRFLTRYVPLGLMAFQLGVQSNNIVYLLGEAEVQPISLPKRYSRIYLRDEVTSVIAI